MQILSPVALFAPFSLGTGGTTPPADPLAWCTADDLVRYCPAVRELPEGGIDTATFVELRATATAELRGNFVRLYAPIPGRTLRRLDPGAALSASDRQLYEMYGQDIPDPSIRVPSKVAYATWLLAGRLQIDEVLREVAVRRTLALIFDRAATSTKNNTYDAERDYQLGVMRARLAGYSPRVDGDGDGTPDWEVNPAGRRVVKLTGGSGS